MDSNEGIKRKRSSAISRNQQKSSISSPSSNTKNISFSLNRPIHIAQDSLFSATSGWTDYRGLFNLAILLLFVSNGRVALENLIKYGILISPIEWIHFAFTDPWSWPNLTLTLFSNVTILLVFFMEKAIAMLWIGEIISRCFYVLLFSIHIICPAAVILFIKSNPLYSCFALSIYVVLFLKLTSYVHMNYFYRSLKIITRKKNISQNTSSYPNNINLKNLYYFIFAPTLCYEIRFPRSPNRRKSFMVKRSAELILLTIIIVALSQQWVIPLLRNSVEPFSTMKLDRCLERVLKLAVPNHVIWLICFYTIFHSALNLIAEILRFADRQFYLDFWNAETISEFWKSWNIPVHRWALRHIYLPLISAGYSKMIAAVAVFFVSAFFHEYLVSVPLHMFRLWAYYSMMIQIPLSFLTEKILKGGRPGNIVMWLSLILGQPMAILMYVHDWYIINEPSAVNETIILRGAYR
ncbi:unnamed protein product [Dracunculus medinensis]|uniref:O-acyltransferase n=1 Tax=Dracunculus medinensis TaxID=318479 RepID=A0A0N4UJT1_DRAME|nr:unnamed protein product [Dracunculus medinensis]